VKEKDDIFGLVDLIINSRKEAQNTQKSGLNENRK